MEHLICNEQNLSSTYNYRRQIEKELLKSLPERVLTLTHSGRVIRTAASILKLNLLECALLAWLLRRSNYTLRDLSASANHIALFEEDQNKQLLLLILLNAYHVKSFLNNHTPPDIDAEVLSLIPQFSKIYKGWRPDSLLKDAPLHELNITFNSWTLPPKKSRPDYNQLVNKILELSKTYNVGGNQEDPPKKKRKHNEEDSPPSPQPQPHQPYPPRHLYKDIFHQQHQSQQQGKLDLEKSNSMMLRSSRMQRHSIYPDIYGYEEDNNELQSHNLDSLRRSSRLKYRGLFDLDNSKIGGPEFGSNYFNNTIFRTNSKGYAGQHEPANHNPIKRTSSFEQIKE